MIDLSLLWYLLIPLALWLVGFFMMPRAIDNMDVKAAAVFSVVGFVISCGVLITAFYMGIGSMTSDVEIWNGAVTDKKREHGSYVRSYSCNCRESCSGSGSSRSCTQVCDTCYEDHYTVTWNCFTSVGTFTIDHKDWTSRAVYALPDPQRWMIIKKDDPVSRAVDHTNYVKAVPESLFRPAAKELKAKFASAIPPYPSSVYDFYKVDRVLAIGVNVPNLREWNDKLSDTLKHLGPSKQVNAIIVFVNADDPNYEYALQDAWLGAKKNDVVLIIGTRDYPKIEWVRVLSWTERELFKVRLRDEVLALSTVTVDGVMTTLHSNIASLFERKRMRDFKYLQSEIAPPTWVILVALSIIVVGYGIFWFMLLRQRNENRRWQNRFGRRQSYIGQR